MKNINNITLYTLSVSIILLLGCDKNTSPNDISSSRIISDTKKIEIKEVFSSIITRNKEDHIYSGQIKSGTGLTKFEETYEVALDDIGIDFEKQMLIFGITDNISTRAFQFLHNKNVGSFTLDYTDTGIMYKLVGLDQGKKYSYLQVFTLKKINDISHIEVKNLISEGLSKMYDK